MGSYQQGIVGSKINNVVGHCHQVDVAGISGGIAGIHACSHCQFDHPQHLRPDGSPDRQVTLSMPGHISSE